MRSSVAGELFRTKIERKSEITEGGRESKRMTKHFLRSYALATDYRI